MVAALVALCLPVTVTVTPWAAGAKLGDVRPGSSAMLGRGGRGGRAQPGQLGDGDRRTGTPRHAEPPPQVPLRQRVPTSSLLSLAVSGDRDKAGDRGASLAQGEGASAWREVPVPPRLRRGQWGSVPPAVPAT